MRLYEHEDKIGELELAADFIEPVKMLADEIADFSGQNFGPDKEGSRIYTKASMILDLISDLEKAVPRIIYGDEISNDENDPHGGQNNVAD